MSGLAAGWIVWARWFRRPSPAAVCEHLFTLAQDGDDGDDDDEDDARRSLSDRVAPGARDLEDPRAAFADRCGWYMDALVQRDASAAGAIGRCLVDAASPEAATDCLSEVDTKAADDALRSRLADNPTFPTRRPAMPEGLEPLYDALVEVGVATLSECDAVLDLEKGCYVYLAGSEERRELARAIPGPVPQDDRLVLLEASCSFDAARWVERHPRLLEHARTALMPVQRFNCNLLPVGDLEESYACDSAWKPYPGDSSVAGGGDNNGDVLVPYAEACEGRLIRIDLERADGEGRFVDVRAYIKGDRYTPPLESDPS